MDETGGLYAKLEERILARDQIGTSAVFYDLVRTGRPPTEILRETVRIHAPYTHVPYHQRIDNGFVRFVNNDHCLLSARTSLRLPGFLPKALEYLPVAQTIWYVPTGLDPWNQLLGKAPGHYGGRGQKRDPNAQLAPPARHWPDQEPVELDGPFDERLDHWLTLVQRGDVVEAYRVFLGLFQERAHRRDLLAHLAFGGLIDVQDRMLYNRSYTTGHKGYRARATIELGDAIGWDNAHDVLYAGVLDMAVGPRWHSAYEMACQVSWLSLAEDDAKPKSSMEPSPSRLVEERLLQNATPLSSAEAERLIQAIIREPEPAYLHEITALLLAGKDPRRILDAIQIASARVILTVGSPANFSMPHHSYEYANTLGWFYDRFDHPHRLKLLYVAGSFVNQAAHWVRHTPGNGEIAARPPQAASSRSPRELLERLDAAQMALEPEESRAWVQAYLDAGCDRAPLVETLAVAAVREGNDPHNQEIGLCLLEDYGKSTAHDRDTLLLACAHHTAGHQKFGDPLEAYRRFTEALA
ncbi:MAG: hypothetical protein DMD83_08300 [Candidatus Rokuibacteriota bacterium]|nr:MAG: hypothetical protein DMD83_08300 [Candidatus Rokubacteria bacterium]